MYTRYYIWEEFKQGDREVRQLGRMDGYMTLEEARVEVQKMQASNEEFSITRRFFIAQATVMEGEHYG